ncbi:Avirulence (Avh) protein [Phytophthora megakarya]|uniref:Avirulence (Avh) protein n=1 Tax=Phytophthora megakarya TaxID=4795 RepID=A0A225V7K9_9STRA|nr:Avirulence (Avh) protein [Phytophthora megakarya]
MPSEAVSAMSTLSARYDDGALHKMIQAAKNVPSTRNLAIKLKTEQMEHWVKVGKDPDDVFHLFKLDKTGDTLFSNPEFTAWVKYVDDFNAKHVEEPASITPTLMNYYSEGILFKMAEAAKKETETKDIATKLETEWLQTWLRNRKSPDKILIDLGFGKAADTLLESPLFHFWAKYLDDFNEKYSDKKTTMIETFTKTFGDAGVTTMLYAAKKRFDTNDIAKKLESDQLRMWLSSEKSVDDLFTTLHLDKIGYDFSDNPLFKTWTSYANVFIKEHPEKKTSVFSSWEDHISDRLLIKMLEEAKKIPAMENPATKVQLEKIHGFLASKKTPEEVFKVLGLDDAGDDILSTPLFQPWLEYVKDFNKHNPNQRESWYDVLRIRSNWFELERLIEQALANPNTAKIGKMVENRQKRTSDDVFHQLHLQETNEHTLVSPKFKLWSKYLDDFNERYSDQKTTVFDVLDKHYSDRTLLKMFNNAQNEPKSKKLATKLQNSLINKWLVDKKTPADLKKRFNDVETADELIQRYVKELEKTGVSSARLLRTSSTAADDDENRASFVDKIMTVFSTSKVSPQQLQSWLKKGESSDTVFTRLQLSTAGDNLFDNPQFVRWIQYTDDLSAKMPKETVSAMSTLAARYDDDVLHKMIQAAKNVPSTRDLATKLKTEQMEHWVKVGKDPDDVFHLFKLDKTGDKLFSNPEFTAWAKYVDDFNTKHPEEPASITPTLINYYSEGILPKQRRKRQKQKISLPNWKLNGFKPGYGTESHQTKH